MDDIEGGGDHISEYGRYRCTGYIPSESEDHNGIQYDVHQVPEDHAGHRGLRMSFRADDIAEGIAALEQMVKESNFGSKTSPKVTWYDYTGGWDHVEREYRAHYHYSLEKMCDGIYLDECDLVFTQGGYSTVSNKNFMFTPEFDHVNDLYNCLIHNLH